MSWIEKVDDNDRWMKNKSMIGSLKYTSESIYGPLKLELVMKWKSIVDDSRKIPPRMKKNRKL